MLFIISVSRRFNNIVYLTITMMVHAKDWTLSNSELS